MCSPAARAVIPDVARDFCNWGLVCRPEVIRGPAEQFGIVSDLLHHLERAVPAKRINAHPVRLAVFAKGRPQELRDSLNDESLVGLRGVSSIHEQDCSVRQRIAVALDPVRYPRPAGSRRGDRVRG